MAEAIRLMKSAFARLASGEAQNQSRQRLVLPNGSALHYMAASDGQYFGTKVYSTHPAHGAHFLFLLYRASDAQLLAIFQANYLGQIRTGAVSGLATQLMARKDAATLGIIGSGFQAKTQLEAILAACPIKMVKVWSRSAEKRNAFASECSRNFPVPVEATQTAEQAVRDADVVVTATSARDPVLDSAWVRPGTHINAMGSNQATRAEVPADLVRRADWIVVDSYEQARIESGDLLLALAEAQWNHERIVELKDVVAGRVKIPSQPRQITLFKSNGLAVEDVIAAGFVYEKAQGSGLGHSLSPPVYS